MAIGNLITGLCQGPRVRGPALCATLAVVAFGATAAASAGHWYDLQRGGLRVEGMTVHPAPMVGAFAIAAVTGAPVTLVLLGAWLRPGADEWISAQVTPESPRL